MAQKQELKSWNVKSSQRQRLNSHLVSRSTLNTQRLENMFSNAPVSFIELYWSIERSSLAGTTTLRGSKCAETVSPAPRVLLKGQFTQFWNFSHFLYTPQCHWRLWSHVLIHTFHVFWSFHWHEELWYSTIYVYPLFYLFLKLFCLFFCYLCSLSALSFSLAQCGGRLQQPPTFSVLNIWRMNLELLACRATLSPDMPLHLYLNSSPSRI